MKKRLRNGCSGADNTTGGRKNAEAGNTHFIGNNIKSNEAAMITVIYCVLGVLWILFSDLTIEWIFQGETAYQLFRPVQTLKGWFYIFITALLLYFLIRKRMELLKDEISKSSNAYEELRTANIVLMKVQVELQYQKKLTDNIILEAPVIIFTHNEEGWILSANPFAGKLFGFPTDGICETIRMDKIFPEDSKKSIHKILEAIKTEGQIRNFESPVVTEDGRRLNILWNCNLLAINDDKEGAIIVSIGTDIDERKRFEDRIKYLAFYDALTGLPNRTLFENEINKRLVNKNANFMIVYIDIDNFKNINDSMGHQVGDIFIKYFTDCLKVLVEEPDMVARMGGDEFAILYPEITKEQLIDKINIIRKRINRTWSMQNHQFYISMSIGVVMYPQDGMSLTELLKNADIAMYTAKREGKNRVLFYKEDIKEHNSWQAKMINNLQYGIEEEQFTLYYQPQYKLVSNEIIGMEALVRWIHPVEGFIEPGVFIPLAEETGQIYSLERLIITKALTYKKLLEEKGLNHIVLSINLSGKTLTSEINFKELEGILENFKVDYSRVVIEITETASISDVDNVINHLNRLKHLGLRVALDDFGTGYSSLNYLKKFPIDIIKLDRSFISAITENGIDTLLIKNIIYLAHDLQYEVVAEGIETQEQLLLLGKYNCEAGQGYLLSKPLPEDKLFEILQK
ncbi:MAG: hypothetical protein K0S76_2799 [Herbinix sp.]|jgi:diguanylate cyclase (GGDEF)-like protein/PAS domain S-box-containing protein|nr:hypothetical protein [Herbinix sp.]